MNYDTWLEKPYQDSQKGEPPDSITEMLDMELWLDGEKAVVESYESWEDADEDGRYGGVDFVVRYGDWSRGPYDVLTGGRTKNLTPTELHEALADQAAHRGEE